jgi:hypothetical protein
MLMPHLFILTATMFAMVVMAAVRAQADAGRATATIIVRCSDSCLFFIDNDHDHAVLLEKGKVEVVTAIPGEHLVTAFRS